jgi:DNA-binding MarR family transcriptional regulator
MDTSIDHRVLAALRRIVRAIDLHSRHLMDQFGVTGPQLVALQELARLGEVPVGLLARQVHVSHPTMTGILDRLERRGLITRVRDERDRRRMNVTATDRGRQILEQAPSPLQDRFRNQFSRLEEWEQTQMLATLQRIAALMAAEELDAAPVLTTEPDVASSPPPHDRPGPTSADTVTEVPADPQAVGVHSQENHHD